MTRVDEARELLYRIAYDLMRLSFDELQAFLDQLPSAGDEEWRELPQEVLSGQRVGVHALVGRWGLLRTRISVEIFLSSDDGVINPKVGPSFYFEKFKSGKLKPRSLEKRVNNG